MITLFAALLGREYRVNHFCCEHIDSQRLISIGIRPGNMIEKIIERRGGPCIIKTGASKIAIGYDLSKKVMLDD